jgi:hypothetical protein
MFLGRWHFTKNNILLINRVSFPGLEDWQALSGLG